MVNKITIKVFLVSLVLFTSGCGAPKCNHNCIIDPRVEPTCETSGLTQGSHCSICEEVLVAQEVIPPLGHEIAIDEKVDATCIEGGLTEGSHCLRCGKILKEQEIIPSLGHDEILKQETTIPHYQHAYCDRCKDILEYTLPKINISCASELSSEYSDCHVSTSNCLDDQRIENVAAQVKVRGNWTATLPKKPFRIKYDKKQSMFGLNDGLKAKSWVLLADYADKSMIRNATAFLLASELFGGKYYSSDCCFTEVYINDDFQGIYLLAEQQQINKGRVDIYEDKNDETSNIGYFFELDHYYEGEDPSVVMEINYNSIPFFNDCVADESLFLNKYVVKNDLNNKEQRDSLETRLQKIWDVAYFALYQNHSDLDNNPYKTIDENGIVVEDASIKTEFEALNRVIDIESLVDTYLFNEIIQNQDVGYSSFFMSLDLSEKGNKKITFQAPWDFDWSFGNSIENLDKLYIGNFLENEPNHEYSNPWLLLVSNSQWFWKLLQKRWFELENVKEKAIYLIDTFTTNYSKYIDSEYEKWSQRSNLVVWCSSKNTLSVTTQKEDSKNVINYLNERFYWLNYYLKDLSRVKDAFNSGGN